MKRLLIPLGIVLLIALIGGMGYLGFRSTQTGARVSPQQAAPQTVTAARGEVEKTVTAPGKLVGTIVGILMALFLNNGGGAWDNAKKFIETGQFGGKRSEPHKAAVVGDTVGDPFKDTAGPSLHVLVKLLSTITLVLAPLFI